MTELDACFPHLSRASFEAELTTNQLAWYLVSLKKRKNQVDSWWLSAGLWAIEDEGHITNVGVHPDYRQCTWKHSRDMLIADTQEGSAIYPGSPASNFAPLLIRKIRLVSAGPKKNIRRHNEDAAIMWLEAEEV
jgi:ribosomal-protein-alanine N-acetyltransferase